MAINQAFLRIFRMFDVVFVNLSCLLAIQPRFRTLGHFLYSTKFLAHCYERSLIKGKALEFNFSRLSAFISLLFDRDSGHKTFLEDAFENEARMIPGGKWGPASSPWTNVVCFLLLLWFIFNFCRILSGLFLVAAIRDQYFRVSFNKQINYN